MITFCIIFFQSSADGLIFSTYQVVSVATTVLNTNASFSSSVILQQYFNVSSTYYKRVLLHLFISRTIYTYADFHIRCIVYARCTMGILRNHRSAVSVRMHF